jgi:hypothetical protein
LLDGSRGFSDSASCLDGKRRTSLCAALRVFQISADWIVLPAREKARTHQPLPEHEPRQPAHAASVAHARTTSALARTTCCPSKGRASPRTHHLLPTHAPAVAHARSNPASARTLSCPRTHQIGPRAGKACSSHGPAWPARGRCGARARIGLARAWATRVRRRAGSGSASSSAGACLHCRRSRGRCQPSRALPETLSYPRSGKGSRNAAELAPD